MKRLLLLSLLALAAIWWLVYVYGPFHYGTIARGVTPDGRDYMIARTSYDCWDGWNVDYFVRGVPETNRPRIAFPLGIPKRGVPVNLHLQTASQTLRHLLHN